MDGFSITCSGKSSATPKTSWFVTTLKKYRKGRQQISAILYRRPLLQAFGMSQLSDRYDKRCPGDRLNEVVVCCCATPTAFCNKTFSFPAVALPNTTDWTRQ
jgi:hypothetical protein